MLLLAPRSSVRLALFACLVATGLAAAPAAREFAITAADRAHWAFQPVQRPAVPELRNPRSTIRNPIDAFLLAKLNAAGLAFSPPATKEAQLRRVSLDLTGLPPSPGEREAFLADASPDAWTKVVDRLLASPHYGERWGRHWLDLARYADTEGFEHDLTRPNAWRYRDYVVRAFNADKPYDRFVREQIAGDELWPADPDALIATGFNLIGPDMTDSSDQMQRRLNTLNDMTDATASVFLGQTFGCARCHDHKFEPVAQRDYFALQAFFMPAAFKRETPVPTREERAAQERALAEYQTQPAVRELVALEAPYREKLRAAKLAKQPPEVREAHNTPPERRTAAQENLAFETAAAVTVADKDVLAALSSADRERRKELAGVAKQFAAPPGLPTALTLVTSNAVPAAAHILNRGDYNQPRDLVPAGFPQVIGAFQLTPDPAASPRARLAGWVASAENPLTARVLVNRVWQHHFGRGLVATPSEFGTHGAKPSHPELLDWLASEFVAGGWSLKKLHRLMVTSEAYRQSSSVRYSVVSGQSPKAPSALLNTEYSKAIATDPANLLLWHMNRLRLEGEVIRDSLLAVSGRLNPKPGGPGVFPPVPAEAIKGAKGWNVSADPREHERRSLYIFAKRNLRFPFLEVFDAPDSNLTCPERGRSTTAPQSLTLLNAEEVLTASRVVAARLEREAKEPRERVTLAYRLILGRDPTAREQEVAAQFLAPSPLTELCRALFNLNEFVYAY
ncbi:MAG: DUF1553 domain-containing protein [Proteobacteria bacterium]|nr:DUF1553 domain-containing protein [Pseudomonadota bacterium]